MKLSERKEKVIFFGGEEKLSLLHLSDIHLWYSTGVLDEITTSIEKMILISLSLPEIIMTLQKGLITLENFYLKSLKNTLLSSSLATTTGSTVPKFQTFCLAFPTVFV